MRCKPLLFFCMLLSFSCRNAPDTSKNKLTILPAFTDKNPYPRINTIALPDGYTRLSADTNSFATWLRNVELKESKVVYLFDGSIKPNQSAQFAVLNVSVGNKNLQQCADAVMRLRAEYLFDKKRFDEIVFTDNANTRYAFTTPYNKQNFTLYLERVFGMCGSASLSKQLKPVNSFQNIAPGDVIIRGGFPGHAVIVMDVAEDAKGKKIFMLAQSYMPAQDIHVLVNPIDESISPWYKVDDNENLYTPEYHFFKTALKRW